MAQPSASEEKQARILIAVPTYRRPAGLLRLLEALDALETTDDVRILVADNEGIDGQGIAAIQSRLSTFRWPIDVIGVPERGLAAVRNAMIAYARSMADLDYLAMVDDDERPTSVWLRELIAMQRQTKADIVGGPTVPVFPAEAPEWPKSCSLYTCGDFDDGPVDLVWGTCNVMFAKSALFAIDGPLFDVGFNELGGEDVDAFMRLRAAGCRFAWARRAQVLDDIPMPRLSLSWIARRAFRIGNSNMLAQKKWIYPTTSRVRLVVRALVGLAAHALLLLVRLPFPARRLEAFCLLMRSAGKLALLTGFHFNEYGTRTLSPEPRGSGESRQIS